MFVHSMNTMNTLNSFFFFLFLATMSFKLHPNHTDDYTQAFLMDFTVVPGYFRIYQHQISCPACNIIISISFGLQNWWQLPESVRSLWAHGMSSHSSQHPANLNFYQKTQLVSLLSQFNVSPQFHMAPAQKSLCKDAAKQRPMPKAALVRLCLSRGGACPHLVLGRDHVPFSNIPKQFQISDAFMVQKYSFKKSEKSCRIFQKLRSR